MEMNVSKMQGTFDKLCNKVKIKKDKYSKEEWQLIDRDMRLMKSYIGKLQKERDQEYEDSRYEFDLEDPGNDSDFFY